MNVLILINSAPNYKFFFNELSRIFIENGHKVHYAIDSHSSTYMEPLSDIDNLSNSYYFSDYFEKNYNTKFEQLYACTYGEFFYSDFDRFLTHGYNLNKNKHYWNQARLCLDAFFDEVIKNNKIDLVLYENISNSFAYSAWRVSQLNNARYIGIMGARLPGRFELQTSIVDDELQRIRMLTKQAIRAEDIAWFNDYKKSIVSIQPDYMKNNALNTVSLSSLLKLKRLKTLVRIFKTGIFVNGYYEYQRGNVWKKITNNSIVNLHRFAVTKMTKKFFYDHSIFQQENEAFFVYPIHYHPESSTSVLASSYTNEYNNIVNIANNLPYGIFLYVKDHISAKGTQSYAFYKKISNLPNVKLIDSSINIKELLKKSKGIITVNSTAGYEALLLDKPVYLLGRVFYECFPNVVKLHSFADISKVIHSTEYDFSNIHTWFIAYKNYTFEHPLYISNYKQGDSKYYSFIYDCIMTRFNENR